ncbi:MAG TPA: NAD(P)-dependent oxidoreductase [Vicinamibacterales bacterium]|jgi:3-hydroxyisobutyrate dehydrogenase-like beta-hydroxyacid dehydrogenase
MQVGFIGLGRMGKGMAHRILTGRHDLVVYDVVRAQTAELAAAGARVAASPGDLCTGCEVVITMLVEDSSVLDVAFAAGGLRDSMAAGAIHLAMGTYGVSAIRALAAGHAAASQRLVAAPVLGRPDLAASGQLGIVAGGPPEAVRQCEPLLELMGRHTFQAGPTPEAATAIKLANNQMLGCAMVAMAEAFSLVRKFNVVPQVLYEVMTEGLFSAPAYKIYGKKMVEESYDQVGSPISVGLKDANLILAAADLARVPMPSLNVYRDRLLGAVAHGDGERDQAVLAREQARASGLE